jgi:Tfp pilus assembly protein PilE
MKRNHRAFVFAMNDNSPRVQQSDRSDGTLGMGAVILGVALLLVALLAAVAVTDLREAVKRGKVKRTMATMRSIGTAWEEYAAADVLPSGRDGG